MTIFTQWRDAHGTRRKWRGPSLGKTLRPSRRDADLPAGIYPPAGRPKWPIGALEGKRWDAVIDDSATRSVDSKRARRCGRPQPRRTGATTRGAGGGPLCPPSPVMLRALRSNLTSRQPRLLPGMRGADPTRSMTRLGTAPSTCPLSTLAGLAQIGSCPMTGIERRHGFSTTDWDVRSSWRNARVCRRRIGDANRRSRQRCWRAACRMGADLGCVRQSDLDVCL